MTNFCLWNRPLKPGVDLTWPEPESAPDLTEPKPPQKMAAPQHHYAVYLTVYTWGRLAELGHHGGMVHHLLSDTLPAQVFASENIGTNIRHIAFDLSSKMGRFATHAQQVGEPVA